jgi:hypothetical protein
MEQNVAPYQEIVPKTVGGGHVLVHHFILWKTDARGVPPLFPENAPPQEHPRIARLTTNCQLAIIYYNTNCNTNTTATATEIFPQAHPPP